MLYNGITLELPKARPQMTHSVYMDLITGQSSSKNIDWYSSLGSIPWGLFKDSYPKSFEHASHIFSMGNMNYQVCNGGIDQYFFNGYHEEQKPYHENDVVQDGIEVQKGFFYDILCFAKSVFPERTDDNTSLEEAYDAFDEVWYEENAIVMETVYCDEDEYIWDEELQEDVLNPDYFEPYDEPAYENVIHGEDGFDVVYYNAKDYIEELLELQAQVCCKQLVLEIEKDKMNAPSLLGVLKEVLPESAFKKRSLIEQIKSANERVPQAQSGNKEIEHDL